MKRYLFTALVGIGVVSSFTYGVAVGHYRFFPFDTLVTLKLQADEPRTYPWAFDTLVTLKLQADEPRTYPWALEQQLMQYAFTREAPSAGLIYSAISNSDEMYERNRNIFTPREDYYKAYDNILIGNAEQMRSNETPVLRLPFTLNGRQYEAFAYGEAEAHEGCESSRTSAALIIPGSGNNQSLGTYENDPTNYHYGIIEALNSLDRVYVQIKPNRDARAWHNGAGMRMGPDFVYNWQLTMGGSYSVSYLIEALALMKYLNRCSERTVVAGLSQGGAAALYVALQASPSQAIVSSGYTVLAEKGTNTDAGFQQLVGVPGSEIIASPDGFIRSIRNSRTSYLFTWGRTDSLYFRQEALYSYTASLLQQVPNALGVSHDGGHIFPVNEIMNFLRSYRISSN
jgi:hypothetical protein